MRKIIIIAFLILAAAITGIFYSMDDDKALSATAHTTKVGVLLSGAHTDKNYCQSGSSRQCSGIFFNLRTQPCGQCLSV